MYIHVKQGCICATEQGITLEICSDSLFQEIAPELYPSL